MFVLKTCSFGLGPEVLRSENNMRIGKFGKIDMPFNPVSLSRFFVSLLLFCSVHSVHSVRGFFSFARQVSSRFRFYDVYCVCGVYVQRSRDVWRYCK